MNAWASLETALEQEPLFFCEKPDGRKDLSEDKRAAMFVALVHRCAPACEIAHVKNEGAYNHAKAKKLGVVAGFADYIVTWKQGAAFVELKGYTAAGRPGVLSDAQIAWGNRKYLMGHAVACFFSPEKALDWLRDQGAPVLRTTYKQNGTDCAATQPAPSPAKKELAR